MIELSKAKLPKLEPPAPALLELDPLLDIAATEVLVPPPQPGRIAMQASTIAVWRRIPKGVMG